MIGRAGYLLAARLARPDQLLLLAFAKKAAEELQERIVERLGKWSGDTPPKVKTFHALGLEIVGAVEGKKPRLSPLAEDPVAFSRFVDTTLDRCLDNEAYRKRFLYYTQAELFSYRSQFDFTTVGDYQEYVRTNELRTLKGVVVKSFEEVVIGNFLSANGIPFEYERKYEIDTRTPEFAQYRPDFYLPEAGVYIEHFALDKDGNPPRHFGAKYRAGVEWKRQLHARHRTKLIETYSYLKREGRLEEVLKEKLLEAGITFRPRSDDELLAELRDGTLSSEISTLFSRFVTLFRDAAADFEDVRARALSNIDSSQLTIILDLVEPIVHAYNKHLANSGELDFSDMIWRATEHASNGRFVSPYRHILVDEFQDISGPRAKLLKAILRQSEDSVLYAVGDDWQSIYRFAGSDISYTRNFESLFGATASTALDLTFRFNQEISDLASRFVLKNPSQLQKSIRSLRQRGRAAVSLVRIVSKTQGLHSTLEAIARMASSDRVKEPTVLVLARYHFVLESWTKTPAGRALKHAHPTLSIQYSTIHAAKGKEADYVVVLDVEKGKNGFPCEKPADPVLEFLLPPAESFPLAEERRLFYVALTRARHRIYVCYNPLIPSLFVRELVHKANGYLICDDELSSATITQPIPAISCPECRTGHLVPRSGTHGPFVGCDHFPYCKHIEQPCPQCGALMERTGHSRVCSVLTCRAEVPICPSCGGDMVERSGPYGRFWGCLNYRKDAEHFCSFTKNIDGKDDVPRFPPGSLEPQA